MSLRELGIEHKRLNETLAVVVRANPQNRDELRAILDDLRQYIPEEIIAGPPFCVFQFITSLKDGFDVEVGFPVSQAIETDAIRARLFPPLQVLSLTHRGPAAELGETYKALYGRAAAHGLI
ncbi:MAG: GyrI-like domain-containing protein, partial [Chloroflexi bacterium]|nr:GyrI-like domain-containing protein [Chloroflexota bacterium]